tara:strand:+ start:224 stop:571 length:348 start_codon:yes stop_codon:yes gene_type:complete
MELQEAQGLQDPKVQPVQPEQKAIQGQAAVHRDPLVPRAHPDHLEVLGLWDPWGQLELRDPRDQKVILEILVLLVHRVKRGLRVLFLVQLALIVLYQVRRVLVVLPDPLEQIVLL